MKHIVIGTAGHIDHGKSCLTTALTEDSASRRHIDRLKDHKCTPKSGVIFLEAINNLERVADHAVNIV